mgnify:FL=1
MFQVEYCSQPKKFLKIIDKIFTKRIIDKIEEIRENPFRYLEHYEGDYYKLRIGDYRALIDIDFENKILIVRVLDKRGRVYKK